MGFETVITANHFSHFLLTLLLLPKLKAAKGRVVNVSSSLHKLVKKFDFDNIQFENNFSLFGTYAQSKLANVLFTFELQRRYASNFGLRPMLSLTNRMEAEKTGVTANALHPGNVLTEVTRNMNFIMRWGDFLCTPIMLLFRKIRAQGAWTSIHVATAPELEGVGGKYFLHCASVPASVAAYDTDAAKKLWEISMRVNFLKSNYSTQT